jgi:hypothetical protein
MSDFYQEAPALHNQWQSDSFFRTVIQRLIPQPVLASLDPSLNRLGERAASDLWLRSISMERDKPYLVQFDAWGRRIDSIITCPEWKGMKSAAAEEGIVSSGYEQIGGVFSPYSRIYQFAKIYLFAPSSGLYSCPLAMTDGAACLLERLSSVSLTTEAKTEAKDAFSRLTSKVPSSFWTSGQWMTERAGTLIQVCLCLAPLYLNACWPLLSDALIVLFTLFIS